MTTPDTTRGCPNCGAAVPEGADWRFCNSCGSPLAGATCPRCETPLTPGSRFCHRCGLPVGARAAGAAAATAGEKSGKLMTWGVAGVALLALFAFLMGRTLSREATDEGPAPGPGSTMPFPAAPAVDISRMSPEERAERLYNRVMMLATQGKSDSVAFFAPMAIESYQMLGRLDEDQHYDVGRIAAVAGALPLARAHADSILARSPTHLLGLLLAASVAELEGDLPGRAAFERRLIAAEAAELRRAAPEYERHREEILTALATARARAR